MGDGNFDRGGFQDLSLGNFGPVDSRLRHLDRSRRRLSDLRAVGFGLQLGPRRVTDVRLSGVGDDRVWSAGNARIADIAFHGYSLGDILTIMFTF